jgi:hypothetical protein
MKERVLECFVATNEVRQRTWRVSESCVTTKDRDRGRTRRVSGCNDGDRGRAWRVSNCNVATNDGDSGRAKLLRRVSDCTAKISMEKSQLMTRLRNSFILNN